MDNNYRTVVVRNFLWKLLERGGAQIVSLVVSVVLARLLDPDVYGTVALVTVFTTILQVFVDSGMGSALIQKKDADDLDFSSVFYMNLLICSTIYVAMFFAAPLIAAFYGRPELTAIVRVMCLSLVISGVRNIQQSYVSKNMLFKRFFYATVGGTWISAVVGIVMAYAGCGVWALVAQTLVNELVGTIILWFTVKWRPKLQFSFSRVKGLLSYGWKLLAASLLDTVYMELRQLIIGKLYSTADLAFYNKGRQFPNLITTNVNSSINSIILPTLAKVQDNVDTVRNLTRRAIKVSSYIMWPLMVGLAVCAEPLVTLILTDTWLPSVPYLRIFCFSFAFYPIHTSNLGAIKALGRSDLFLKIEITKKIVGMVVLLGTMWFGVMTMAYSLLLTTITSGIINSFPNKSLLNYSYIDQIKDILPSIALSAVMGVVVYMVQYLGLSPILTLLIQVPLGALVYVAGSWLFKMECFHYVLGVLKNLIRRK